ncbi:MAG: hypothetical protein A2X67_05885 [Ignavibacteria bacterium GWA2_55_11]|nr:MAG: hypothetical protein A2X67_05885 [Ignavibacteria bacterium GWA2_55_11]OGU46352.1 MAG: hypothetical protein A2X68_07515 [Ignavibacteria bacterium GWC2_56_12]OGU65886.1 MAG: hypothetical protein A3C56_12970 [Ignavibacteria bacterium RIFCSPHIGHO2_02_FULL_56_12]OGU70880.1 MAG: hypothetical protein A3G43_02830 [Ignavibacteria bacterium RIFCSPLOWO2_12_FULL_56_21]HAL55402.1 four helix bundle protein [Bacteroidota bacterium]
MKSWGGLEDLEVYRQAREFRKEMYRVARILPEFERYNTCSQIRDAARSLTNNIAEGYGRYYYKESIKFFRIARGSLEELVDDLNICLDESYIDEEKHAYLTSQALHVRRLIDGYIKYLMKNSIGE